MNKLYFCTLFDSNYLTRGIAMYESLKKNLDNFTLYICTFDNKAYEILSNIKLQNVVIIKLEDLEKFDNGLLLSVKNTRNAAEYCWTSTGVLIKYCLDNFKLDHCTYLDADIYFYSFSEEVINLIKKKKVLLTPHRYTPEYDQSFTSGKYCVQFLTFWNIKEHIVILDEWIKNCINWCYARYEDGKFGDQKYLDEWPIKYPNDILEVEHLGIGLAPWNIQQFKIINENNKLYVFDKRKKHEVVFYHFHGLKFIERNRIRLGNYKLSNKVIKYFYIPYIKKLLKLKQKLNLNENNIQKTKYSIQYVIKRVLNDKNSIKRFFKRIKNRNIYDIDKLLKG